MDSFVFFDFIVIMILFLIWRNNLDDSGCVKCFFGVVKNYILGFRFWNLSEYEVLKDGFEVFGMIDNVMLEILEKFFFVFYKIV